MQMPHTKNGGAEALAERVLQRNQDLMQRVGSLMSGMHTGVGVWGSG